MESDDDNDDSEIEEKVPDVDTIPEDIKQKILDIDE